MQKINFQNLPSTTTPINATNLNAIQTNAETAINDVADDLSMATEMYNDTSGSDWETMLKNKLDWCISNITTTQTKYQTFINGGWQSVRLGFGIFSKIDNSYQIIWISQNEICYCLKTNNTYTYRKQDLYEDGFFKKIPNSSITANMGTLSTNASYVSQNSLNINLKITGVSLSANSSGTIATLPSNYHASTESSLMAVTSNYIPLVCWLRNNGTIAIATGTAISNVEVRIVGSVYID